MQFFFSKKLQFFIFSFYIIFFFLNQKVLLFGVSENENDKSKSEETKILRIVTDQMFEDLFLKFGIVFGRPVNIVRFRENKIEELTMIFEEVCQGSEIFSKKNLPKYEAQIIVSSREMNVYEKTICGSRFEKIKLGYYAFLIASKKENNDSNQSRKNSIANSFPIEATMENDIFDFSSEDFFKALSSKISKEDLFEESENIYSNWNDVNKFLPKRNIKIYGPKSNSPFFLFLQNSVLMPICLKQEFYYQKYNNNYYDFIRNCSDFRLDEIYIEDNQDAKLSSDKILTDSTSFFILPFHIHKKLSKKNDNAFILHNFDGVSPSLQNIRNLKYRFSWPIYFYIDSNLLKSNSLAQKFVSEVISNSKTGGFLEEYGLIPLE
jgi:hypothetical protein